VVSYINFLTLVYFLLTFYTFIYIDSSYIFFLLCSHLVNPDNGLVLLVPYPCSSVFVFYWVLLFVHIIPFLLLLILMQYCLHSKTNLLEISFMILFSYMLICLYMHIIYTSGQGMYICEKAKGILLFHISSNCISCFKVHFMCALPSLSLSHNTLFSYIIILQ
jgi:hypothetical protein